MKNLSLHNLKDEILNLSDSVFVQIVHSSTLDKDFLLTYTSGTHEKIMLFDGKRGFNQIALIYYAIKGTKIKITDFEVDIEYQNKGIGRFLFNLALALSDLQGKVFAYGDANPINEIKGIESVKNVDSYTQHIVKLFEIYQSLGCSFNQKEDINRFETSWKHGEKFNSLNETQQEIVINMLNFNKELKK